MLIICVYVYDLGVAWLSFPVSFESANLKLSVFSVYPCCYSSSVKHIVFLFVWSMLHSCLTCLDPSSADDSNRLFVELGIVLILSTQFC